MLASLEDPGNDAAVIGYSSGRNVTEVDAQWLVRLEAPGLPRAVSGRKRHRRDVRENPRYVCGGFR
jgi:hypothetical protein